MKRVAGWISINDLINSGINCSLDIFKVDEIQDQIDQLLEEQEKIEREMSALVDTKVKTPNFSEDLFNTKYQDLAIKFKELSHTIGKLELDHAKTFNTKSRLERIDEFLKKDKQAITELDTETLRTFVYRMISISPTEIVYCIAGTRNYSDQEFTSKRHEFLKIEPLATGTYFSEKYQKEMNYRVVVI